MPKRLISLVLLLVATAVWGNMMIDPRYEELVALTDVIDPVPLSPIVPEYPESLISTSWEGECNVVLYIDEEGGVRKVWINRSTGEPAADEAALEAARNSQWEPGRQGGRAISRQVSVTITFTPPDDDTAKQEYSSTTTEP